MVPRGDRGLQLIEKQALCLVQDMVRDTSLLLLTHERHQALSNGLPSRCTHVTPFATGPYIHSSKRGSRWFCASNAVIDSQAANPRSPASVGLPPNTNV